MCQYSAVDGHMTDWHLVHLGGFAIRGAGTVMLESTAVAPEGRISPECPGIWSDTHIAPMKRIVDFIHGQGTTVGIQLAHAGRKASTFCPYVLERRDNAGYTGSDSQVVGVQDGGWPENIIGPSDIPFSDELGKPKALTEEGIQGLLKAYMDAVERCKKIGFDFIEIHGAHGYLLHSFYSPISNNRTDKYGGSLENRLRFPLEVIQTVRAAWDKPLFLRLSATEWAEKEKNESGEWVSWGIEQSVELSKRAQAAGVDLMDVQFAARIKKELPNLLVGAVGLITEAQQAEDILQEGKADVVLLARELMRNMDFPLKAAEALGLAVKPANQYEMAWRRMSAPKSRL
ncbi:Putative NADPH dehydrogenase C23G7,10c OS=Schizosaccharomyces pombe (strain 972 / ATCC 24843) GN=SPBC23G7.10c PE=3 SV=1 [Rhizoctonia solani AG-1 IB]|uniref:Putative NADPH dehydrogenase C23G7,10c n=1 Tax=Thanatephorus cucumeris (strain AG1-IB / isolate 7/3/14) TaxID=1108050 RepID=A0A0B7F899_THACB|nr:Putative NADPH dehydrogenase C23G7,10c OS=Schizosaccharomyces pombe (strain 972 / ATCC 24843) GN=SPBC23G7.10c PE=3 SV=1 [Rhizoctonia solani AG-1 IB]